jgi:hypothetical protein
MTMTIIPVERAELRFAPWPWPFADRQRAEIDAHFAKLMRGHPALWNGQVLLLNDFAFSGKAIHGSCFDTDFASFIAWRDWGWPDHSVRNCFSAGALVGSDGGFLLGVMGGHTANPGRIYFPCGTPDPRDLADGRLDLDGSIWRELGEETGLTAEDAVADPGFHVVLDGQRVAALRLLRAHLPAAELRARILAHLAAEAEPELADIRIVRDPGDLAPMMPAFIPAFLTYAWREGLA